MNPLYQLAADLAAVIEATGEEGELTPEHEAALDALTGEFEHKLESIVFAVRNLESLEQARRAEADRLLKAARANERTVIGLKRYVMRCLEQAGRRKSDAGLFRVRIKANSVPTVTVACHPEMLPDRFQMVKIEPDRKQLAEVWKRGEPLPDGVTVETGSHLRIN